jgi:hypothetical protein
MNKFVVEYISICTECQQVKVEHQHLGSFLQPFSLLGWKWEVIRMYFVIGIPKIVKQHETIMVVVYKLRKSTHIFPL